MPLIVRASTPEEQERTRRFQVHKNYVGGIALFVSRTYGAERTARLAALLQAQRELSGFRRIRQRQVNNERLAQYLTLAWASELQYRLAGLGDASLLQYSNAWAPVHAYYAVYMGAQAWFTTIGAEDIVDNHTGSLNTLSNQITQRDLFPLPWNVTCSGCPHLDEHEFNGLPADGDASAHVELLSAPRFDDFWPRFGKLLETTRRRRLDRNIEDWKRRRGRKNTRAKEKRELASRLLPTTVFDFFWRLRVRSNYRDVRTFLMAGVTDDWQEEFYNALLCVTESSLALLENLVVAYSGPEVYRSTSGEFIGSLRNDVPILRVPFEERAALIAP